MQGIKLESFIFDPLPLANNLVLMEADRSAHFAPVKNANGSGVDSPKTARDAVLALHRRYIITCTLKNASTWQKGSLRLSKRTMLPPPITQFIITC